MVDEPSPEAPAEPGDGPAPPATAPDPPKDDWETRYKYLLADFENFRRRTARDESLARERNRIELLRRMLPFFDAVEQARVAIKKLPPSDPVRRGFDLLFTEWAVFLELEGVRTVARLGSPFRAEEHEAIAEAPPAPGRSSGTIVEIVQQGYATAAGVLRPAKVVVARKPEDDASGATETAAEPAPPPEGE